MEQRACIKFCFKLGKTATETHEMMKTAFGENAPSRIVTFDWFKRFKKSRQSLDDARSDQPSTARYEKTVKAVRSLLTEDPHLTLRAISEQLKIKTLFLFHHSWRDFNRRKICARFVPHFLTPEQKEMRVNCCRDFVEMADKDPDFIKIIGDTCNKT